MVQPRSLNIRAHRLLDSENVKRLVDWRLDNKFPVHVSPFSCLIVAMGNYWEPGCWEAVEAMAKFSFDQGYMTEIYEEHDRCYNPYDGLGIMRNMGYRRALDEGFEFVCYVDNDVKPPKDALVKLMHRFVPVIAPIIRYESGDDYGLDTPKFEEGNGLALVGNVVLSMLVFQTRVFLPWALHPFWRGEIGADESYHFKQLEMAGHRPFLDTDVTVMCAKGPTFPLDNKPSRG